MASRAAGLASSRCRSESTALLDDCLGAPPRRPPTYVWLRLVRMKLRGVGFMQRGRAASIACFDSPSYLESMTLAVRVLRLSTARLVLRCNMIGPLDNEVSVYVIVMDIPCQRSVLSSSLPMSTCIQGQTLLSDHCDSPLHAPAPHVLLRGR